MKFAKCEKVIRDKYNRVTAYLLKDEQGQLITADSKNLKLAILNGKIDVINLMLTSDNKLVYRENFGDTVSKNQESIVYFDREALIKINSRKRLSFKSNIKDIESIKLKSSIVGSNFVQLKENMYAVENNESITIISDKQLSLTDNCKNLFLNLSFKSIDLNNLKCDNIFDMSAMFMACRAEEINFGNIDTSKVTCMQKLFYNCKAKKLDLRRFNTSKVFDMSYMFCHCEASEINLSSFDTSNVFDMNAMFYSSYANEIDLRNFNTSNVVNMNMMFSHSKAESINVSSFNTRSVDNMAYMFSGVNVKELNIRNFVISHNTNILGMFDDNEDTLKIIATNKRIIEQCRK